MCALLNFELEDCSNDHNYINTDPVTTVRLTSPVCFVDKPSIDNVGIQCWTHGYVFNGPILFEVFDHTQV